MHPTRPLPLLAALALLLVAGLKAQTHLIRQAVVHPTTNNPEAALPMISNQKTLAVTADGTLWSLVRLIDGSKPTNGTFAQDDASRHLLLYRSTDGGAGWQQVSKVRTTGSHYGSIATGPDGHTLHVAWYAWNGKYDTGAKKGYSSIFYSAYDTHTGKWAGSADEEVVKGTSDRAQYSLPDIAVTEKGVVGVVFTTRYARPAGWVGTGTSWQGGLLWKKGGKWSAPHQVNQDGCGVRMEVHALGDDLHMAYRVTTGGYGTSYRRFDTAAEAFGAEGEKPVVPNPSNPARNVSNLYANSDHSLSVQPNGDLYLAYATGQSGSKPPGKIWYVYAKAGTYTFSQPHQVDDDTAMAGGNTNWYTFAIARTPGGAPAVFYTKVSENYQNLYMRTLAPTGPLPPYSQPALPIVKTTVTDSFRLIGAHRAQNALSPLFVTYRDQSPKGPLTGGAVMLHGTPGGTAVLDVAGCAGSLKQVPRLAATGLPAVGTNLGLALADLPAGAAGLLLMGRSDRTLMSQPLLPMDLTSLGAPGCHLAVEPLVTIPFQSTTQGGHSASLPVPADPWLAGMALYWQGFLIAPGANPASLVATNGLGTCLR